jgi:hypothetical protein
MRNATVVGEEDEGRVWAPRTWVEGGGVVGSGVCVERNRKRGRRKRIRPFFLEGVGERGPVAGVEVLCWRNKMGPGSFISSRSLSHTLLVANDDFGEGMEVDGGMGSGTTV